MSKHWTVQTAEPLAHRRLFHTGDLDQARAIVAGKFCDHRLDIAATPNRFDACHHRAEGRAASLNYIRYGADVKINPGELGSFYLIQIPLHGQAEIQNGSCAVQTGRGVGSVLNPHRHTRMRWREGCAMLLLQIDGASLNRIAERLANRAISGPVTFDTAVDEANAATANWVQKLRTCFNLADRSLIFADTKQPTQVAVEDELISDFLMSQPSDVSHLLRPAGATADNLYVRRAVRFIEDNFADPITLTDISFAVGISARSLQLGFKTEFERTPMQYLRDHRLIMARQSLLGSDDSIGNICHSVGISHLGRFSADYRAMFGETPRDTARRTRG